MAAMVDVEIGRDTLIALAAVAWADGKLSPEEAEGLRTTAEQLSLPPEDKAAIEGALSSKVDLSEVETIRMNRLTRLFTYAAASWIAELDQGSVAEQAALGVLGDRLGLSSVARERARSAALSLAQRGDHPGAYDLGKLRARLSASLSQVGVE